MQKTRVLSIFFQKGGVGKTTISINLAAALALMLADEAARNQSEPGRVLVIDLDPQTHAEIALLKQLVAQGQTPKNGLGKRDNIAGLLKGDAELPLHSIIRTAAIPVGASENLDFIPSSKEGMSDIISELVLDGLKPGRTNPLNRLQEIVEQLEEFYEYIILDTPPELNLLSLNSLVAATHVLIPLILEGLSLESLSDALRTIESIRRKQNKNLKLIGLLPNMVNFQLQDPRMSYDQLREKFGDLILAPLSRRADVSHSIGVEGLDIFSYRQSSAITEGSPRWEFAQMAQDVRRRMG